MELTLERRSLATDYTAGRLYIDGKYFCDTIEDKVRNLDVEEKVYGETAIPYGTYKVAMDVVSPRFANHKSYRHIGGKLPRLLDVPHFEGILIHIGNYADYTKVLYSFDIDKTKEILQHGAKIKVI